MGLQDPVGQVIKQWGEEKEIIGVVKDFHFESFHETVKPMFFVFDPVASTHVMARIVAGSENETLPAIAALYKKFNADLIFDFSFLDQDYQALYASEMKVSALSKYFAGLAVLISCLGLLGLAQFTADRRIKEIGIRKILGASVIGIISLLAGQFTRMVLMAVVIAIPISYFITDKWLQTFAFRISLTWSTFVIAGLIALGIAWLTISLQTFKAARINPARCLRDE
jgi:ABC-type antimicrobial peptide transport system permease subunit